MAANNGWKRKEAFSSEDQDEALLVWHTYQGAMLATLKNALRNPFYEWAQRIEGKWTPLSERTPRAEDADVFGCVLAEDAHGVIKVYNIGRLKLERDAPRRWMKLPGAPTEGKE